jgi:hypothetical protein
MKNKAVNNFALAQSLVKLVENRAINKLNLDNPSQYMVGYLESLLGVMMDESPQARKYIENRVKYLMEQE